MEDERSTDLTARRPTVPDAESDVETNDMTRLPRDRVYLLPADLQGPVLSPQEWRILFAYYGERLPIRAIAVREGITPERCRSILDEVSTRIGF